MSIISKPEEYIIYYNTERINANKIEIPNQYGSYRHKRRALKCGKI